MIEKQFCKGCHWSRDINLFEGFKQCNTCRTRNRNKMADKRIIKDQQIAGKKWCSSCYKHKDEDLFNGYKACDRCEKVQTRSQNELQISSTVIHTLEMWLLLLMCSL